MKKIKKTTEVSHTPQHKRELLAWAFLPMMMGAVDGGVVGILTKGLFEGHVQELLLDWSVATLAAAQGFANISSFFWAAISNGKHKVKFITLLKFIIVLFIGGVAFIPQTTSGLFILLACVVARLKFTTALATKVNILLKSAASCGKRTRLMKIYSETTNTLVIKIGEQEDVTPYSVAKN